MKFSKIAAGAILAAAVSTASHATVVGSFSGGLGGTLATPNAAISSGTLTTLASTGSITTSGAGDFSAVGFLTGTGGAFTLNLGSLASTSLTTGVGTFVANSADAPILNTVNNTLEIKLVGTFDGAGVLAADTGLAASADLAYTQVGGVGTAISGSYTIAVPPAFQISEPLTIAVLGAGLVGLGMARCRRD